MKFVHGTSSAHLESINEHGLLPPIETGNSSEKRTERLNSIHVLGAEHIKIAGAYALRASHHWGGEPIIISGELPDVAVTLAIEGKKHFPDIYTVPYVPHEHIETIVPLDMAEDMSDLFKIHKS